MSEKPLLNEDFILNILHPSTAVSPDDLRTCLRFLVLDCYDRKILREPFDEILVMTNELAGIVTRAEFTALVTSTFRKAGTPTPTFDATLLSLQNEMAAKRLALLDKFAKVMECPTEKLEIN